MQSNIDPEKTAAYEATRFWVLDHEHGNFALRIGQPSAELKSLYRRNGIRCAAFVTAYNPLGTMREVQANEAANRLLLSHLKECTS